MGLEMPLRTFRKIPITKITSLKSPSTATTCVYEYAPAVQRKLLPRGRRRTQDITGVTSSARRIANAEKMQW